MGELPWILPQKVIKTNDAQHIVKMISTRCNENPTYGLHGIWIYTCKKGARSTQGLTDQENEKVKSQRDAR